MKVYRFGNCYLNLSERQIIKNGIRLVLTPKTFDVLQLLVENSGKIISKDEILGKVWDGSFVEEGNLAVHISKLRKLLTESKAEPFIETVPGLGYRFVATVLEVINSEWQKQLPEASNSKNIANSSEWLFDSIAVFPLENETNDDEIEYLADGLTENIINSLSLLSNLKVIARNTVFRYKNKDVDVQEIGKTLNVSATLTGRIRSIKDIIIVSIELTKVEDGRHLWGMQINKPLSSIIEIQESIVSAILEKMRTQIESKRLTPNSITQNSESYKLYLKGNYFFQKREEKDIYKAIDFFLKSISHDPVNVNAYSCLIECYGLLFTNDYIFYEEYCNATLPFVDSLQKLKQVTDIVHTMYGRKFYLDWKFKDSERHFKEALSINPNNLSARYGYIYLLLNTRNFEEVLNELPKVLLIDPISLNTSMFLSRVFYRMELFESAMIYIKEALEFEPQNYIALTLMGSIFKEKGQFEEALNLYQKALSFHYNVGIIERIGILHGLNGQPELALEMIHQIKSTHKDRHAIKIASIYVALNNYDMTYKYLETAFDQHDVDLTTILSEPIWAKIRDQKKFKDLFKKVIKH